MKNNKGITLIALVITIIVLLILAGVSIAMLAGDNSILSNATKSAEYNKLGEAKDIIGLAINEYVMSFLDNKYGTGTYIGTTEPAPDNAQGAASDAVKAYMTGGSRVSSLPSGITVNYIVDSNKIVVSGSGYYDYAIIGTSGTISWNGITKGDAPTT